MSVNNQKSKGFFSAKNHCQICDSSGQVEICSTNEQVCDKMPCAHCNGNGYLVEYNKGRMAVAGVAATAAVALIIYVSVFIITPF